MIVEPRSPSGATVARPHSGSAQIARPWFAAISALRADPVLVVLIVATVLLGIWNLSGYPETWFDEGMYLQVGKNLVQHDLYAVRSADGTLDYAPIVGVGPTLILPVALTFRIGGVGLAVGRAVPVIYLLVATLLLYLIGRALFGRLSALAGVVTLFSLPSLDWLGTGRQALGEVPMVVFLLAGGVLACRADSHRRTILAGIVLGLTMVTKGQALLIVPATIVAVALVDRYDTRQRPLRWYGELLLAALVTYAVWIAALLIIIGGSHIMESVRDLRSASGGALLVFNIDRMLSAAKLILGPSSLFIVAPAAIVGLFSIRRATGTRRLALTGLWLFMAMWLGWFMLASIAWPRYAFPALAVSALFIGDLVTRLVAPRRPAVPTGQLGRLLMRAALSVAVVAMLCVGLWRAVAPLAQHRDDPQVFAATVERLTPPQATIDGWEPEIGFLTNRAIQYPAAGTLDRAVRATWLGGAAPDLSSGLRGDYLIVGPFARWVGVYHDATVSPGYRLIARVGAYELFARVPGANLSAGDRRAG